MSESPVPEAPTFRGKTLTPESPRPLHATEPHNIPVLQNQIDPIFNLMSSHLEPPHLARNLTAMDHELEQERQKAEMVNKAAKPESTESKSETARREAVDDNNDDDDGRALYSDEKEDRAEQKEREPSLNQNQKSSLPEQHPAPVASFDAPGPQSMTNHQPTPALHPLQDCIQHVSTSHETPSASAHQNGQTATEPDPAAPPNEGQGVRGVATVGSDELQSLLDHLTAAKPAAISACDISNTNSAPADANEVSTPSSANPPSTFFAVPTGLPPRPPPQEKPSMHPNYAQAEDIRPFHYPHMLPANATGPLPSQSSNPFRLSPSMPSPLAPPGSVPGSNGLPPPPVATFQQPPVSAADPRQRSPMTQQYPNFPTPGAGRDDGNVWTPEVERLYNQFLDDEAAYTAEGAWDKFPQGSRLFVGK
jgi:hypothetical protein